MKYVSTRSHSKTSTFEEVFLKGLAEDGGLFVPQELFKFNQTEINSLKDLNYQDLATEIIFKFTGNFIDKNQLSKLIQKSYSTFRHKNIIDFSDVDEFKIMELFHGPTLAFKDIAMQFIGNLYEYYLNKKQTKINIIVATSGDTGSAAINAVKRSKNINIFCLYPKGRISEFQRRQMSTVNQKNIFLCEVEGTFDDCQKIVKNISVI